MLPTRLDRAPGPSLHRSATRGAAALRAAPFALRRWRAAMADAASSPCSSALAAARCQLVAGRGAAGRTQALANNNGPPSRGASTSSPATPAAPSDEAAAVATLAASLALGALLSGAGVGLDDSLPAAVQGPSAVLGWSYFSAWTVSFFPQARAPRAARPRAGNIARAPRASRLAGCGGGLSWEAHTHAPGGSRWHASGDPSSCRMRALAPTSPARPRPPRPAAQILDNHRTRDVSGLSPDYILFSAVGYGCYTAYTGALLLRWAGASHGRGGGPQRRRAPGQRLAAIQSSAAAGAAAKAAAVPIAHSAPSHLAAPTPPPRAAARCARPMPRRTGARCPTSARPTFALRP